MPLASMMRITGWIASVDPLAAPIGCVVIADADAAPAVMLSELEVTAVKAVGVKVKVKAPAVPVITRLVNVAIPEAAATVVVPESVPVPDAIDATTLALEPVTVLPLASMMRITGWIASVDPLAAPVGCVVIADADAVPASVVIVEVVPVSVGVELVAVTVVAVAATV